MKRAAFRWRIAGWCEAGNDRARPILRAESIENPGLLLELIEWRSASVLGGVMENERIQAKWSEIKARWKRGDFPIREFPEAGTPWSILRSLP